MPKSSYKSLVMKWRRAASTKKAINFFKESFKNFQALAKKRKDKHAATCNCKHHAQQRALEEKKKSLENDRKYGHDDQELRFSGRRFLSRCASRISPMPATADVPNTLRRTSTSPTPRDFNADSLSEPSFSAPSSPTTEQTVLPKGDAASRKTTRPIFFSQPLDGKRPQPVEKNATPIFFSQSFVGKKPQPIEKTLECTLEELCFGRDKKINITRPAISSNGLIVQEKEKLEINVQPGWKKGTKILFKGKGGERPGTLPADIIFSIDEKKHLLFTREGDDLELGVEVPLVQALSGCTISVPLLGGGEIDLFIDDIIYPGYAKIVPGQGMPKSNKEGGRGDLRLKFLVAFPDDLTGKQRSEVFSILQGCS